METRSSPSRLPFGRAPGLLAAVALLFGLGSVYGLLIGELDAGHLLVLGLMLRSARAVSELRLRGLGGLLRGMLLTLALSGALAAATGALVRGARPQGADTGVR